MRAVIVLLLMALSFNHDGYGDSVLVNPDTIVGFNIVDDNMSPQEIVRLMADGTVKYGPAWSLENLYKAVCSTRRYGDCI